MAVFDGLLNNSAICAVKKEINRGWFENFVDADYNVVPNGDGTAPPVDATEFTQLPPPLTTDMTQGDQIPGIATGTWASSLNMKHSGDATGVQIPKWFYWAEAPGLKLTDSVGNGTGLAQLKWDKTHRCSTHSIIYKDYTCGETAEGMTQYIHGAVSDLTINLPGVNQPIEIVQSWTGIYGTGVVTATGTITATGTAVVGSGTAFTSELSVGKGIRVGDEVRYISAITDDTNLTLETAFTADPSGATFEYQSNLDERESDISPETPKTYTGQDTTRVGTLSTVYFKAGNDILQLVSGTITIAPAISADTNSDAHGGANWYGRDVGSVTGNFITKKVLPGSVPYYSDLRDSVTKNIEFVLSGGFKFTLTAGQITSSAVERGDRTLNQNTTYQVDTITIEQQTL